MKALQPSRLLEVVCQPRFPSLKTMLLTKCPSLGWGNIAMSSSLQDPTPSRAGCRPRWSWEPTYTFLGLALPQHQRAGPCLVGAAYSLGQCSEHESSASESTDKPHAGKLARVILAGDPGKEINTLNSIQTARHWPAAAAAEHHPFPA
ncbi:hypothetical protein CsSME_00049057 [Camellia sinensis var. sinensis]